MELFHLSVEEYKLAAQMWFDKEELLCENTRNSAGLNDWCTQKEKVSFINQLVLQSDTKSKFIDIMTRRTRGPIRSLYVKLCD